MVDVPEQPSEFMVDPSVLGSRGGLDWFLTIPRDEVSTLVFPGTFLDQVQEALDPRMVSFYGLGSLTQPQFREAWAAAKRRLISSSRFGAPAAPLRGEAAEIHSSLRQTFGYPLGEILGEEWTFLMSRSWIGSRLRRPFTEFFKAGATVIQVGWRRVAARTLRLPPQVARQPLTGRQHARAVFQWVAAGVSDALALFGLSSSPASALGFLGNVFFLLDP